MSGLAEAPIAYPIDPSGNRRAPILYRRASLVPRHLRRGQWSVTAKLTARTAQIGPGWRVVFDGGPESGFGGPVRRIEIEMGDESGARLQPRITLSGPDDMCVIDEAEAYPDPANLATAQGAQAYDVRTGTASGVILAYIARNIGHLAIASRVTPSFNTNIPDPNVGISVSGKARFSPLLEEIVRPLAEKAGLRVWVTSTTSGARTLHIGEVVDRTGAARFSVDLGNLKKLKYTLNAPEATVVIGGGRGEETAREFVLQKDDAAISAWGRIEAFYDYRAASGTDSGAELTAGTAKKLADSAAVEQVEVIPVDTDRLRYGVDYQIGDQVLVEVGGGTGLVLPAPILETEITIERTGNKKLVTVQPKIGNLSTGPGRKTQQQIADLLLRISRLERR
ncbi:hypothetical protein [Lentzea sp. NBRC 105346]|uniref:Gp37-like protein n=1 Tax=Lentzea sp. NBRC 105346 TaxID=3032205 RepID=UPI0025546B76|nr:hypothetical protein [Lentzea sp. NBRC 105346]